MTSCTLEEQIKAKQNAIDALKAEVTQLEEQKAAEGHTYNHFRLHVDYAGYVTKVEKNSNESGQVTPASGLESIDVNYGGGGFLRVTLKGKSYKFKLQAPIEDNTDL